MEPLEISAKTVDEAVDSALNKLGLNRSEVSIEVLQEGKGGIFGWRVEEAKVRVTPLASVQEPGSGGNGSAAATTGAVADAAREVVVNLLSLMDVPADIQVTGGGDDQSPLVIEISNEARDSDLGILIGRRGQSL
ncbi:MAG: Jag N-terminal domain-containing protein, partial [Dehalococcoidia bacterium]